MHQKCIAYETLAHSHYAKNASWKFEVTLFFFGMRKRQLCYYTPQTPGPYYQLMWGMLSTRSVWDSCLKSDGATESELMKYYNGPVWLHCLISYPVDASRYLGMWLDLTTAHRQTWLSSSTSTYHSTVDMLVCERHVGPRRLRDDDDDGCGDSVFKLLTLQTEWLTKKRTLDCRSCLDNRQLKLFVATFLLYEKTYWKTTWAVLNSTAYRMHGLTVYIVKRMYWCVMMFKRRVDSVWYCADSCAVLRTDLITLHRKNCTAYLKLYKPSCKLKCKLIIIKFVCLHVGLFSKN